MCMGVRTVSIRANIWSTGLSSFTRPTLEIESFRGDPSGTGHH